jgi:hypothetical protein
MVTGNKPDLRGIPKPWVLKTREEKEYDFRLREMSDNLRKEAHDNNLANKKEVNV